jgi:glycine/D-amino acid oxidase-like deaminating enzyme
MRSRAQAVVIGGGIVGCSVLYHLAKLGWTDELTPDGNKPITYDIGTITPPVGGSGGRPRGFLPVCFACSARAASWRLTLAPGVFPRCEGTGIEEHVSIGALDDDTIAAGLFRLI